MTYVFFNIYKHIHKYIVLVKKTHLTLIEGNNGWSLALRDVIEETQSSQMILGDQVLCVVFNIIQCPANPIVIELPWFELHNLDVNWNLCKISSRSKHQRRKQVTSFLRTIAFMHTTKNGVAFALYATPIKKFNWISFIRYSNSISRF